MIYSVRLNIHCRENNHLNKIIVVLEPTYVLGIKKNQTTLTKQDLGISLFTKFTTSGIFEIHQKQANTQKRNK